MPERHPGWVTGVDESDARLATGLFVSAAGGTDDQLAPLRSHTGLRHGPNGPGEVKFDTNKVTVNPFQAVIADSAQPASGAYLVTLDAAKELPIEGADSQHSRIDRVVAVIDLSAKPYFSVQVIKGDAAATPEPKAIPQAAYLELARVILPPAADTRPITVTDLRRFTAALGGIIPVGALDELPKVASNSQFAYQFNSGILMVHHQGEWVVYRPPAVQNPWLPIEPINNWKASYLPTIASASYQRSDDGWVRLRGMVTKPKANSSDPQDVKLAICTLPEGYRPAIDHVFGVMTAAGSMGPLQVTAKGLVIQATAGGAALNAAWTSLEGVAFTTY